jgi:hypothetical protein
MGTNAIPSVPKIAPPLKWRTFHSSGASCHKNIYRDFDNGNSTTIAIASLITANLLLQNFVATMTMDTEPRQHQTPRQQSLAHALSLLQGGSDQPDQPDQPGSNMPGLPGLQPRGTMGHDEELAFLLAVIEQVLAITSGVDDDASIFVNSPLDNDEDNDPAHNQDQ